MKSNLLEVSDVAKLFKTSMDNIYIKIHRGIFPKETYFKLGRRIYFNEEKLINWLEAGAA